MVVLNKSYIENTLAKNNLVKIGKIEIYKKFIISSILLLCGIVMFSYSFPLNDIAVRIMGIAFLGFGIAYTATNLVSLFKMEGNVVVKNADICEYGINFDFKFKEKSIDVISKVNNKTEKFNVKYNDVKKIIEHDDYYEIILKDLVLLYVLKSGFQNEKMHEFYLNNIKLNKLKIKNKKSKK